MVGFDEKLTDCDLVLTGEGRFDSQSIRGKVISGVSKPGAGTKSVPVVVVAGSVDKEMESVSADPASGIAAVFSINRQAMDYSESKPFSRSQLSIYAGKSFCGRLRCGGVLRRLNAGAGACIPPDENWQKSPGRAAADRDNQIGVCGFICGFSVAILERQPITSAGIAPFAQSVLQEKLHSEKEILQNQKNFAGFLAFDKRKRVYCT